MDADKALLTIEKWFFVLQSIYLSTTDKYNSGKEKIQGKSTLLKLLRELTCSTVAALKM